MHTDVEKLTAIQATVEQTSSMIQARMARPYYPLNDGWGLTHLDSGQPFYVNTRDRTVTPWILMGGHWETNVERPLCGYIDSSMTIADIGAHCGYYTVKMGARLGGEGRLVAFEPNPEMYPFTENNILINGLAGKAKLFKSALGSVQGKANLAYRSGNEAQASLVYEAEADRSFSVLVDTFDNAMAEYERVDLIKLDAEGFEGPILEGAQATLRRSPKCAIMMELNLGRWEQKHKISDLFDLIGGDREAFAVTGDGRLKLMQQADIRDFLLGCLYSENYFFFIPRDEDCHRRIAPYLI